MTTQTKSFQKFLLLWIGELISAVGSGLTSFGLGVYIFEQTGKASAMALVTLLGFMPSLLLGAIAGVLADRYDRRLLMILGDSLSVLGLVYILFCMTQGEIQLWQICIGVTISSVFTSLVEPAYRATVTDLLTKEQYTKASGLVQVAASSKYLISPALAGLLLSISNIKFLILLDIGTFFITVLSTLVVRRGIKVHKAESKLNFIAELKEGWEAITMQRGVLVLVWTSTILTFCMGFLETLAMPMILTFASSTVVGILETVIASGMLVSSVIMGLISIRGGYVKILSITLGSSGIFMALFGLKENIIWITISGFLFFAMLPFANASLDYLIRTNIENEKQGRAWGLMGVISQLGYVASYALSGVLADYIFTPLLLENGLLADSVGRVIGIGSGRGIGFLIMIAGMALAVMSFALYHIKSIRCLESGGERCILD
ncbi:MAG: MFS transporter [Cellulosilyticum sp.]|nr:MFS transporter [Cellulosilyticum sp.]